jgi:hypothetical protein
MAYLKYYADENRRHRLADSIKLSFEACVELTHWLCNQFGASNLTVSLIDQKNKRFSKLRKVKSWYSNGAKEIVYHPTMLSPLTVAHEVAHHLHHLDRNRRREEAQAKHSQQMKQEEERYQEEMLCHHERMAELTPIEATLVSVPQKPKLSYFTFPKERWHGPEHRVFVDKAIEMLKVRPDLKKYFDESPDGMMARNELQLQQVLRNGVPPAPVPAARSNTDIIKAFYDSLPEKLTCPCCKFHGHKMNFGVRVMKKDANGVPLKMRAQSYCKACR